MYRLLFCVLLLPSILLAQRPTKATNKHFWASTTTSATPEQIWQIWTDVPNWHQWDTGLEGAQLNEPFALGARGSIVSGGRTSKFKVVEFVPGKSYTFKTALPLGGLYVRRTLREEKGRTFFEHEVWFKGLTGGLFAKRFGPEFRKKLPGVLANVQQIAEQ